MLRARRLPTLNVSPSPTQAKWWTANLTAQAQASIPMAIKLAIIKMDCVRAMENLSQRTEKTNTQALLPTTNTTKANSHSPTVLILKAPSKMVSPTKATGDTAPGNEVNSRENVKYMIKCY